MDFYDFYDYVVIVVALLLQMCKFNDIFITEVTVKGGVVLDCSVLKGVSLFFVPIMYVHEGGRILETPLNIMQSSTTLLTITSVLIH